MEKPVNLNRFRKDKARTEKRARGDANAVKFGRTGAQKAAEEKDRERSARALDQHRRDPSPPSRLRTEGGGASPDPSRPPTPGGRGDGGEGGDA